MNINKEFFVFVVLAILVLQIGFVLGQEDVEGIDGDSEEKETSKEKDLSKNFEGDAEVVAKGAKETVSEDGVTLEFTEGSENSLRVGDRVYENISEGLIELNKDGTIKNADFMTNDEGGIYAINGVSIEAPPNSRVTYKDGELNLPEDSLVSEPKNSVNIRGESFTFEREGELYEFRRGVNIDDQGRLYVPAGRNYEARGITVHNSGGLEPTYFVLEGESPPDSQNYVRFKENGFEGEAFGSKSLDLSFDKDSEYLDLDNGDTGSLLVRKGQFDLEDRNTVDLFKADVSSEGTLVFENGDNGATISEDKFYISGDSREADFPLRISDVGSDTSATFVESSPKTISDNSIRRRTFEEYRKMSENYDMEEGENALILNGKDQRMYLVGRSRGEIAVKDVYDVSTGEPGFGERSGSGKTPTGVHEISNKFGEGARLGTIFRARQNTGEIADIYRSEYDASEDHVTSRVMWLDGCDKNNENSKSRYIYIHGTHEEGRLGTPASHGCVRMRNREVVELFDRVEEGTHVNILEESFSDGSTSTSSQGIFEGGGCNYPGSVSCSGDRENVLECVLPVGASADGIVSQDELSQARWELISSCGENKLCDFNDNVCKEV